MRVNVLIHGFMVGGLIAGAASSFLLASFAFGCFMSAIAILGIADGVRAISRGVS